MKYKYFLSSLIGISPSSRIKLSTVFGNEEELYKASDKAIDSLVFISKNARDIYIESRHTFDIEKDYDNFIKNQQSLVTYNDPSYPQKLKTISDPPYCLFYFGTLPDENKTCIAMVGARRCSAYGRTMARDIAQRLAQAGYIVVSGMARGIDSESHRGALEAGGTTCAVLGCGIDTCYPPESRDIYDHAPEKGCVLSEYRPGTAPIPTFFPLRNRIISGLSRSILVLEAREHSGSLITAELATEQGRDVYALPGRVTDAMSAGCNRLIAQGAYVIRSPQSIISDLSADEAYTSIPLSIPADPQIDLEGDERIIYDCFDFYSKSIDTVQKESGFELLRLLSVIMQLCQKGLIRESFKNEYIRMG